MSFLRRYWLEVKRTWFTLPKTVRGLRVVPRLEPLEVRTLLAGEFTDLGALSLPGVLMSSVAWGDMDNDGDLDILLTGADSTGTKISEVYQNNGNSTFTDLNAGLTGVYRSSVAWGDMDNDGDLDILITGLLPGGVANNSISKVYRNNGNSTFTDLNAGLAGAYFSSVAWGDMDNDGDLDILLAGRGPAGAYIAKVYRNNGNSTFTDLSAGLPGVDGGSAVWGDMDNDGDLDILLTGNTAAGTANFITKIYRNNGNSTFTDLNAGLPGVHTSSGTWGDMDNDGDLDILLTGYTASFSKIARVYQNNGNSTFTDLNAGLTGVGVSSAAWGDMDNDGDLDILLTGNSSSGKIANVYRNNGNSTFTDLNAGLTGVEWGSVAWGDMDNDADLDILLTGEDATNARIAKVYRNNATTANTVPSAPTSLTTTVPSSTSLTFSWTAATDTQTASSGLSYNLRVGTTPGGSDVFSTMASTANGTRRLPDAGPIQGTSFTLKGLTFGQTYYWSVQAIDTTFAGSAFATEQSALVNRSPVITGVPANQAVNDTTTLSLFSALTLTDPDTQDMFARVTILNGVVRGDFMSAATVGWTQTIVGNDIKYERYYSSQANIGSVVQTALRAFVFQPRDNDITPNTTELTDINILINDGLANTSATTRITTTSVNDAPVLSGASNTVTVNDNTTVNPFPNLAVSDLDMQEMLISATILNGVFRGDFTNANAGTGWTVREVVGNDITYRRYFSPQANVGAAAQAAFRALIFQPRTNAIDPATTELTDFQVTVSDGVASAIANSGTRVTTTSINDAPTIGGAVASQTMDDNQTKAIFSTLTITDPDTQDMLVRVTITNGANRGDFTAASTTSWTRSVSGNDIVYARYFSPAGNIGNIAQTATRALIFQPRNNVPISSSETTSFTVYVQDGSSSNTTDSTTSVITTGVAPRQVPSRSFTQTTFLDEDSSTIVLPNFAKHPANLLAQLLRKARLR